MTTAKNDLRTEMPGVTKFIDSTRETFGKDQIDSSIRSGMKGNPTFWAIENRHVIGTLDTSYRWIIRWNKSGVSYSVEADWIWWARLIARTRGELMPLLEKDGSDAENQKIARRAREILTDATPDELHGAIMITREDYQ